jgi:hypothetical protein
LKATGAPDCFGLASFSDADNFDPWHGRQRTPRDAWRAIG